MGAWAQLIGFDQQVWSGNDGDLPGVLAAGGHEIISGVSTAFPRLFGRHRTAARSGGPLITQPEVLRAVAAAGPSISTLHTALHLRTGHPWATRMPGLGVSSAQQAALQLLIKDTAG